MPRPTPSAAPFSASTRWSAPTAGTATANLPSTRTPAASPWRCRSCAAVRTSPIGSWSVAAGRSAWWCRRRPWVAGPSPRAVELGERHIQHRRPPDAYLEPSPDQPTVQIGLAAKKGRKPCSQPRAIDRGGATLAGRRSFLLSNACGRPLLATQGDPEAGEAELRLLAAEVAARHATPAILTRGQAAAAEEALRRIEARGTTDLGGGWLLGCEQVAAALQEGDVARCLLMTDGLANVGIVDPAELVRHARELAARGIATTTFGVGRDFNEVLLHEMAQNGSGNFYFIENATQIEDFVASEVGEALEVVAQDVALHVNAYSTPSRTVIPRQAEHRFQSKPNSDSTSSRTVCEPRVAAVAGL